MAASRPQSAQINTWKHACQHALDSNQTRDQQNHSHMLRSQQLHRKRTSCTQCVFDALWRRNVLRGKLSPHHVTFKARRPQGSLSTETELGKKGAVFICATARTAAWVNEGEKRLFWSRLLWVRGFCEHVGLYGAMGIVGLRRRRVL